MDINKQIARALKSKDPEKYIQLGEAFEDGIGIKPNEKDAIKWYKKAASAGHSEGYYSLACLFYKRYGSKRSQSIAFKYYLEAANQGHLRSQLILGSFCRYGRLTEKSVAEAICWYEKAASSGSEAAWLELSYIFFDKECEFYDLKRGNSWVKKIIRSEKTQLISTLARAYLEGRLLPKSTQLAAKYYKIAATLDDIRAKIQMARLYCGHAGYKKNRKLANAYLSEISKSKNLYGILEIARMLEHESELILSGAQAFDWYKKAAQLGDAQAQMKVGRFYRDGKGCKKNLNLAEHWLLKAAAQGKGAAAFNLGYLYKKDWDKQDYQKSMLFFKQALKRGIVNSYASIGWMYQQGLGVKKSNAAAIRWFKLGIEKGDKRSHQALGWMLQNGAGCVKDYNLALNYYKKAHAEGYFHACTGLGYQYQNGLGCRKNLKRAAEYYRQGMENNVADCFYNTGVLYDNGEYFNQDKNKAIELYEKAEKLGSVYAKFYLALRYLSGQDVKKNRRKALQLLKESILDERKSFYLAGREFQRFADKHFDESNSLDKKQAVYWYEQAAKRGYAWSYISLGYLYAQGEIVKQDISKAIYYYKKAIKAGCHPANGYMGYLYWKGKDIKKNHQKAKELFERGYAHEDFRHKNAYAWLLSTSPNKKLINGDFATKLAKAGIKEIGKKAYLIDTLAASYAATGNFSEAIKTQKSAIRLLKKENKLNQLEDFQNRLAVYQSNKRWVE